MGTFIRDWSLLKILKLRRRLFSIKCTLVEVEDVSTRLQVRRNFHHLRMAARNDPSASGCHCRTTRWQIVGNGVEPFHQTCDCVHVRLMMSILPTGKPGRLCALCRGLFDRLGPNNKTVGTNIYLSKDSDYLIANLKGALAQNKRGMQSFRGKRITANSHHTMGIGMRTT